MLIVQIPFPALELLDIDKMLGNKYYSRWRNNPANKRSFPIFTSRGCPYNCCFCSVHSQVGYQHRMYSIDYVLELMKKCIVRFGINHFHFEDDNLTLDVNRAKRLFKEMASLNISWDTPNGVRADKIDEEMIQLMIASGLSSLSIAAESGNETVRTNIIHKRLTTDSIINAVRLCDKYDLPCIDDFSFALNQSDKVAIIGEEGNGKSTLLKLLYSEETVGNYVHHTGEIIRDGILAYLPQFMGENDQLLTVAEYLADTDFYDDYNIINSLGLEYELLFSTQKISTLSGGEKIKIQLLKLLSDKPDALLLDEPSNDLDIDTLIFLESFIRDSAIPIIFISHDEMLISSCANVIIHIEQLIRKTKCSITVSRLTYEDYLKFRNLQFDRQNQIAHKERSEYKKKRERLLQLYEKARHNTGWKNPDGIASSDGHAKKSMQAIVSKGKRFEREKDNFTEIPDRETGIITKFDSNIFVPSQKRIIDIELPELKIDGKVLSTNIVLSVIGNQHVCIIGKNGAGKSTLLKTIWHELKGRTDIVVGYMPQDYRDVLDYDSTPVDYLQTTYDKETYTKALTFMGTMKFTRDEMHHKIGELSGGQRAKIIYLGMVLQNANVLVLDEPTRNFSPLWAPVIRTALSEFNGTIISISHDRMYLDEVADVIYELSDNGLNTVL